MEHSHHPNHKTYRPGQTGIAACVERHPLAAANSQKFQALCTNGSQFVYREPLK